MNNANIPAIAGGVMSLNRAIDPLRMFVRAKGAYLYDDQGKKYIDYHAAFGPYLLGHGDQEGRAEPKVLDFCEVILETRRSFPNIKWYLLRGGWKVMR